MYFKALLYQLALYLAIVCAESPIRAQPPADTAGFYAFISRGDSIYSQKQGYGSFLLSLRYFDSAQSIAEHSGDALLLARAAMAHGSVYDAWNKEPAKTIALFTQAMQLYKQTGDAYNYYYAKQLVAHAYDKVGDSTRATAVLRELIGELWAKDSALRHRMSLSRRWR